MHSIIIENTTFAHAVEQAVYYWNSLMNDNYFFNNIIQSDTDKLAEKIYDWFCDNNFKNIHYSIEHKKTIIYFDTLDEVTLFTEKWL